MPQRPLRSLAVVGVLALGDYLLWNWSLGANHDVVALVAGTTLIPLLIALVWLAVVACVRQLASLARRSRSARGARANGAVNGVGRPEGTAGAGAAAGPRDDPLAGRPALAANAPPSKLAA